jgi:hypothetical protein
MSETRWNKKKRERKNANVRADWKQAHRFPRKAFSIAQEAEYLKALSMIVWFQIWSF